MADKYVSKDNIKEILQEVKQTIDRALENIPKSDLLIVPVTEATGTSINVDTGKYYRFDDIVNELQIVLPHPGDVATTQGIILNFTTGDDPQITIQADEDISYFEGYIILPNITYELNIMFNGIKWIVAYAVVE